MIEFGYCHCGCGGKTSLAKQTDRTKGNIKGMPVRFLSQHHSYKRDGRYRVDDKTGCWNWQMSTSKKGYGYIHSQGKTHRAYKFMYEKRFGIVPAGMQLDHLCSNRACVNPEHLEPVTGTENVRRGKCAKLKITQVVQIREMHKAGIPRRDLAKNFGVSSSTINDISSGRTWIGVTA